MSVQIKAILHRGPNEEELPRKEIRRFEVEANVSGRYFLAIYFSEITGLT